MRKATPLADLLLGSGLVHTASNARPSTCPEESPAQPLPGSSATAHTDVASYPYPTQKRRPSTSGGVGRLSARDRDKDKFNERNREKDGTVISPSRVARLGAEGSQVAWPLRKDDTRQLHGGGSDGGRGSTPPLPPAHQLSSSRPSAVPSGSPSPASQQVHVQQLSLPPCHPTPRNIQISLASSISAGRAVVGLPHAVRSPEPVRSQSSWQSSREALPLMMPPPPHHQQQQQQQQSDSREAGIPHAQGPAVSSSEGLCKPSTPALHPRPQERAPPPASSTPPKGENPLRKAVRRLSSKLKLDKGHR
mmetsp:Transcript_11296/g.30803  ORF Transcript_11296/g.30803 Transcript_11296/m.30803 type:complete len:306 (-) Transcript_11296:397-1314(-)